MIDKTGYWEEGDCKGIVRYNDWGKHLRLGNWLFNYCGILSMIEQTENELQIPNYFLWDYLENPPVTTNDKFYNKLFYYRQFAFAEEEVKYIQETMKANAEKREILNIIIGPHYQSEKWFLPNLDLIKKKLKFKKSAIDNVKTKYANVFTKPTIGIGIRRGDFVNHASFYQIPESWYMKALETEFPNWYNYNIVIFSDDIEWCKKYYNGKGFFFADPNNTHFIDDVNYHKDPMDQFILGTLMDNFIGGNSTFSWWQMWYVKNFNSGKVVHSGKNLTSQGDAVVRINENYYPESWTLHKI
jgi:hypothetical protein